MVWHVSGGVADLLRRRVGEYHRGLAHRDGVGGRRRRRVRQVDHHPQPVQLLYHSLKETKRKSDRFIIQYSIQLTTARVESVAIFKGVKNFAFHVSLHQASSFWHCLASTQTGQREKTSMKMFRPAMRIISLSTLTVATLILCYTYSHWIKSRD